MDIDFHFVTTNYDCNLERLLKQEDVKFTDDLPARTTHIDHQNRNWRLSNSLVFRFDEMTNIVKLHGSTNWYQLTGADTRSGMLGACQYNLSPGKAFFSSVVCDRRLFRPFSSPLMLRGSISKPSAYARNPYSKLIAAFEDVLEISDLVIVAGFGWSDTGLSLRLFRYAHLQGNLLAIDGSSPLAISKAPGFEDWKVANPGEQNLEHQPFAVVREHMSSLKKGAIRSVLEKLLGPKRH